MQGDTSIRDPEVEKLLRKIMSKTLVSASARSSACCIRDYPPGYEIKSEAELEELIKTCKVVFINYYSPVCPYCELFAPIYTKIASKYRGKAVFARVNVAVAPELAWRYYVMATPTTIALYKGKPVQGVPGYIEEEYFEELVKEVLREAGCN